MRLYAIKGNEKAFPNNDPRCNDAGDGPCSNCLDLGAMPSTFWQRNLGPWGPKQTLHYGEGVEGFAVYLQRLSYLFPNDSCRQIDITFDPDGTVGKIDWIKARSAFSESGLR